MTRRETEIAGLNQAIAQRDQEISGLNQAIAQRDQEIAGLNRAITQRDDEIAGLNQAIAQRDGQNVHLGQTVSENEKKIQRLANDTAHIVADKDKQIHVLQVELSKVLRSRSWRLRALLRKIAVPVWRTLSFAGKLREYQKMRRKTSAQT
jgi:uncharacterized protein (DUF3084 family)